MIRQRATHWLLMVGVFLIPPGAASAAPVRVALVGSHGAGTAGGVVALAEARLSARDGLEVLDRQNVDRVLKEQKLSVAGLVDAGLAIKAGQILSVELFALVEQSADGKETLACIVYDTRTGIRLDDTTLGGDGIEAVSGEVVACVERAVQKRAAGIANVKTLSLVGVRNADLPRSLDTTCESLGLLLERELARSGDVALLERKRLGWLQQERTLTATEADRQLLSSTLQADLQFSQERDGVRATVIVTDAAGQRLHTATADAKQLDASLVAPLVESVLRGLNVKPTVTPTNALRESQRFFREAQQRWSFKEPTLAIQAAEAALLLDPRNPDKMLLLAEYLLHTSTQSLRSLNYSRIERGTKARPLSVEECLVAALPAQRAFEVYEAAYRIIDPHDMDELSAVGKRTVSLEAIRHGFFDSLPPNMRISGDRLGEWQEMLRELSDADWRISREDVTRWRSLTNTMPGASFAYSRAVSDALRQLQRQSRASSEVSQRVLSLLNEWLTCFETLPKTHQPFVYARVVLEAVVDLSRSPFEATIAERNRSSPDTALLEPFLVRLERHPLPLLQLYGRLARLIHKWRQDSVAPIDRVSGLRPLRVDLFALLDRPENKSDVTVRRACYAFLAAANSSSWHLHGSAEYEVELTAICEAMVARRELHPGLFLLGANGSEKLAPDTARRALVRIDAALALSRQPNVSLVDNSDLKQTRQALERTREEFLVRHRDLLSDAPALRVQTRLLIEFPTAREANSPLSSLSSPKLYAPKVSDDNVVGLVMSARWDGQQRRPVVWFQAVSIPLGSGSPKYLGEVATSLQIRDSTDITHVVSSSCVHDSRFYAATTAGLVEFDLKLPTAKIIDTSLKFPASKILSLASFDGRLWLGLEGGYLISFAPQSDDVRVLASSRRKEKLSPLDDGEAFEVLGIVPDPARQRLLFLIRIRQGNKTELAEFWEYRRRTDDFQRLLEFTKIPPEAISAIQDDRLVICSGPWVVSFDLPTNRAFVVANDPLGPNLAPNRQHFIRLFVRQPVMCADRLWWSVGQSLEGKLNTLRLDVDDERVLPVNLPQLDKDEIYAGWYVAPVDNKRFLWSNHHRLWLVTPKEGETKTNGSLK